MRLTLALLAATIATTAITAATAAPPTAKSLNTKDATRLEKRLAGRVAGEPLSCIPSRPNMHVEQYGEQTLLYTSGSASGPVYRNDPEGGCNQAGRGYAIVSREPTGMVCSGEIIRVVDQRLGTEFGACTLGKFTPYSRVKK